LAREAGVTADGFFDDDLRDVDDDEMRDDDDVELDERRE